MAAGETAGAGQDPGGSWAARLGVVVTRVLVPLWLLTGAVLKLIDGSPSNLPAVLVQNLGGRGVDLHYVLWLSVAVELVVVGIAWLLPGLARPVTLVALGCFAPILVGDLVLGAASCGCFGAVEVPPAVTLAIDLGFFLGVLLLGKRSPSLLVPPSFPRGRVVAAGLWVVAAFTVSFGVGAIGHPGAGASATSIAPLPASGYYVPDYETWIGRAWAELDIATWIEGAPADLGTGERIVLFYRKDCEHCHELMELYLSGRLELPTTAVAVPERDGYPTEGVLSFPCTECTTAELPAGVDWFLKTPVLVRLAEGVVECAAEVDPADPDCLSW